MKAEDSPSAADDVPPLSKEAAIPRQSTNVSKDDAASAPPQSQSSSTTTTSAKKQQHQVTEVPKFRFVSIAKKSAGYSSAAAGRWVEGKSAQELAAQYHQEPDNIVAAASEDPLSSSSSSVKKGQVVVGKLNLAERQVEMGLRAGGGVEKKKEEEVDGVEEQQVIEEEQEDEAEEEKEEEEVQPTVQEEEEVKESVMKESVDQSEEKDLEAAVPPVTPNKTDVPPVTQNKKLFYDMRQGVLYCSDSGEVVATVNPVDKKEEDTSKEEDASDGRRKCSTKNRILSVLLLLLLAVVAALGAVFATKLSNDDTSSGLRGENQKNEEGTAAAGANTTATGGPSETPRWDAPTASPKSPSTAFFNEPTLKPTQATAVQRCIVGSSLAEDTCVEEAQIRQQLFVPRDGTDGTAELANVNFGHSLTFINDNILAAATDGSESDAGVHIYFKDNLNLYMHYQNIDDGDEKNLFGYSLAASRDTNTLVVGAPARARGKVECVQVWCEICSWSTFDYSPCGERLDVIVQQSSNGNEEEIKQQIMSSGRCIADEICSEVVSTGKVFIYEPTGNRWERVHIAISEDRSFGSVVAIEAGILVIGSPDEDKVDIYEKNGSGWTLMETKTSQTTGARFGSSLSLSDGILVVGAPLDSIGGAAYVYKRSSDSFAPQGPPLAPRDISPGDIFGEKVSVSGCTVAVSSRTASTASTTGTGSIRIFNYDTELDLYRADQIVEPAEEVAGVFPECLVMEGNNLLAGSSRGGSSSTGNLIQFIRRNNNVWTQTSVMSNPLQAAGSAAGFFGCGLSILEGTALVGAKGASGSRPGSFYVADLCPEDELV
mmetsp:Transcript_22323/g.44984  ORF Transcript_22323/g.44984 Transcript_22323/m.44984 type:complete len:827 (+) Transcript_22323:98-2578(+)